MAEYLCPACHRRKIYCRRCKTSHCGCLWNRCPAKVKKTVRKSAKMPDELPPLGRRVLIQRGLPPILHVEIACRQPTVTSGLPDWSGPWAWFTDTGYWCDPEEVQKWAELPKL